MSCGATTSRPRREVPIFNQAADEVFDSLGRATRDPEVRDGTRKAARSFGSALAETFRDVADEVAAAIRRGDASHS